VPKAPKVPQAKSPVRRAPAKAATSCVARLPLVFFFFFFFFFFFL
jgi:hypothetical protein